MEKTGYIQVTFSGSKGNIELSRDNYDIKEIIAVLENAEDLLFPSDKKDRPIISYTIENGSVKHIFKTGVQYIIGFNALLGQIALEKNIDFLELPTAKAIEFFQESAAKKDYTISLKTSLDNTNQLTIDRTTRLMRTETVWTDAEFYFYGKIIDAGGKDKANIHVATEEHGNIRVATPIAYLKDYDGNILYKTFGVRATGKQNVSTGEIDPNSLKFIELIDYEPAYDEAYLSKLRSKAKKSWLGAIDADDWLREIRGGYEA